MISSRFYLPGTQVNRLGMLQLPLRRIQLYRLSLLGLSVPFRKGEGKTKGQRPEGRTVLLQSFGISVTVTKLDFYPTQIKSAWSMPSSCLIVSSVGASSPVSTR